MNSISLCTFTALSERADRRGEPNLLDTPIICANFSLFQGEVSIIPPNSPVALPLFASGGSLLAFLGWRKKRKLGATAA